MPKKPNSDSKFDSKVDDKKKKYVKPSSISDDEDDDDYDAVEYRKLLSEMFPSKHMSKKVKNDEKMKQVIQSLNKKHNRKYVVEYVDEEDEESDSDYVPSNGTKSETENSDSEDEELEDTETESESECESDCSESDSESEFDSEEEDEEKEDDDDENVVIDLKNNKKTYNLRSKKSKQNKDDEVQFQYTFTVDDINKYMKNKSLNEKRDRESERDCNRNRNRERERKPKLETVVEKEVVEVKEDLNQILANLKEKDDGSATMKQFITTCENKIKLKKREEAKQNKIQTKRNVKEFEKMNKDKTLYDMPYYKSLPPSEQQTINGHISQINEFIQVKKPYRFLVLESGIPLEFKAVALSKINAIKHMDPGCGEYYKLKTWIDTFMRIPFNMYKDLNINIEDGVEKCHDFMSNAQNILDKAVYGLNDAKLQIMQMLGQFITNPKSIGTSIAIHGPPGTGKTSLVKEGISKILNRPFAFIALGGATDSSMLEGHSYTYEGSTWGKIVQILIESKCMNPIIYFDELDKISDTPRGEEIIGILTHLTDSTQNSQYHDKYFSEFSFDLSKCLFIFSYNDESKINPILRDRMYRIQTTGYSNKQKTIIVKNYLLPKIREQVKFSESEIVIPDETISYIMENANICNKESGVRNLKRSLEIIHTKLNLFRLMKTNINLFEEDMAIKVSFPIVITREIVDKLIKNNHENISALYSMYM